MAKKIEKNALKSHRERVEDLNKYLDSLSEVRTPRLPLVCMGFDGCSITTCPKLDLANDPPCERSYRSGMAGITDRPHRKGPDTLCNRGLLSM